MFYFIFQREIETKLHVKQHLQRLFFSGKQLESDSLLDSYNVSFNDIILLMVKPEVDDVENKIISDKEGSAKKKVGEQEEKEEDLEEAESLYYKIGDAVDCNDGNTGAWFEAIIKCIYKKENEVFYKILWEFDDANSFNIVPEAYVRPRARRSIPIDKLSVGQKVMINYDIVEPEKVGLWYDFTISEIQMKRTMNQLEGILHVNGYVFALPIHYRVSI